MKKKRQMVMGSVLIGLGILFLLSSIFNIDFGVICWPSILILAGIFIIVRPRIAPEGSDVRMLFIGDLNRSGEWEAKDQEVWSFVGDVDLDFTQAIFSEDEVAFRLTSFVGDVDLLVPAEIGISISATGFVNEARLEGKKRGGFLTPISFTSENYQSAAKRIRFEMVSFVSELKVVRV